MLKQSKKLAVALLLSVSATGAFAAGTLSGTDISSTASFNFTVNGTTSTLTDTNTYKVDNKIDLVVSTVDTQAVTVGADTTNTLLTYTVRNDGNTVQDFLLTSLEISTSAFTGANSATDGYGLTNVRVFVDVNNNGAYDITTDTLSYIDELAPDAEVTVFIVADVPADAANNAIAVYDLQAQAAQGEGIGVEGTVISSDNKNAADDAATVQIVFADGVGSADLQYDGKFSSAGAWKIVTANLTVSKNSIVISDPVNGTTNPKRIPGAEIRYCYIVANETGSADATGAIITDTLDPVTLESAGSAVTMFSGSGTCDCNSVAGDTTGANGLAGQDPNALGLTMFDFETVAGGVTECAYVTVTIK